MAGFASRVKYAQEQGVGAVLPQQVTPEQKQIEWWQMPDTINIGTGLGGRGQRNPEKEAAFKQKYPQYAGLSGQDLLARMSAAGKEEQSKSEMASENRLGELKAGQKAGVLTNEQQQQLSQLELQNQKDITAGLVKAIPGFREWTESRQDAYQAVFGMAAQQLNADTSTPEKIDAFLSSQAPDGKTILEKIQDPAVISPMVAQFQKQNREQRKQSMLEPLGLIAAFAGMATGNPWLASLGGKVLDPENKLLPWVTGGFAALPQPTPTPESGLTPAEQAIAGIPPAPQTPSIPVEPSSGLGTVTPQNVGQFAANLASGKLTWEDVLKSGGQSAIDMLNDYLAAQPANKEAKEDYGLLKTAVGENVAFAEKMKSQGEAIVSEDYARQMDDLRRSQYMQNLNQREALAERGITPSSKSSIGESEWRRLSESQTKEREGADILRARKMQDIANKMESTNIGATQSLREGKEKFNDMYTSWRDVYQGNITPENITGAAQKIFLS